MHASAPSSINGHVKHEVTAVKQGACRKLTCTVAASPPLSRSMSSGSNVPHFLGKSWLEMTDRASLSCARTRGGVDSISPVSNLLICSCTADEAC